MDQRAQIIGDALARLEASLAALRPDVGWQVWERQPAESDYSPRGGTIVEADPRSVFVVRQGWARGRPTLDSVRLERSALDPALAIPPSTAQSAKIARAICAWLADRGRWGPEELAWLERAKDLCLTPGI